MKTVYGGTAFLGEKSTSKIYPKELTAAVHSARCPLLYYITGEKMLGHICK